jgi:hypothetical protein
MLVWCLYLELLLYWRSLAISERRNGWVARCQERKSQNQYVVVLENNLFGVGGKVGFVS